MGQRQSAADWAEEMDQQLYCVEERRALPPAVTEGLLEALNGEASAEERQAVLARVGDYRERSRRRAEWLLRILDRATAVDMKALEHAMANSPAARYAGRAGFNRFHWILAVSGKGTDQNPANVQKFAAACGAWLATSQIISQLVERDEELARGVQVNPSQETQRRIWAVVVHFRWASELFCTSMAVEIQSNPTKYRGLEFVTQRAVTDLFKWVEAYVDRIDRQANDQAVGPVPSISSFARPLIEALTVQGDEYRSKPFEGLTETLDIEAYPFVSVGGVIAPVALREATYGLELALLNLARRLLCDEKDRSDLFENAVKRSLSRVLPSGIDLPYAPVSIPIPKTKNKGETDFILRELSAHTFIGECKAMAAVQRSGTVIHSFSDDVGKAAKQLKLRMDAVKLGGEVRVDGLAWAAPTRNVYGIAVPLHAYGGAIWNHECLPHGDIDHPDIAVIPVHQLLVVARAMEDAHDLGAYIRFRSALFGLKLELRDELDILAAYIFSDAMKIKALIEGAPEHGRRVIRAYGVELETAVSDVMPTSARAWRNRLKRTLI
ncbi:hypothetical protein R5O87_02900 [Arthrobacter globiformis]|uniref:hypothetical protein n=1 Tax=Arthrobacter globiformis TaxID=1665 RepID=UPI003977F4FC